MADEATPATGTPEPATVEPAAEPETDWKAEAEKWKDRSRKNEERAKSNAAAAKELEELRVSAMSDTEKAVAEATAKARAEALAEAGSRLVDAEIRVAGTGRTFDTDALLGLDRTSFLVDGEPDSEAIRAWVDEHSTSTIPETTPEPAQGPLTPVDLGQGTRASTPIGDDAAFTKMLSDLVKK